MTADPPAPYIFISGPEWSVTLTNSSGLTTSVPTDQYTVESRYRHWQRANNVKVFAGLTASWPIAPRFGAVQLSCNQSDATFQLLTLDDRQEEAGGLPDLITELPKGNYKLISQHHGHQRTQPLAVKAVVTNDNPVEFSYGAADLETTPAGASVQDGDGRQWGVTPLNLPELLPGTLQLTLHLGGYESVPFSLEIIANQTDTFQTNLISTSYTGGMKSARAFMADADYARALQAVGEAQHMPFIDQCIQETPQSTFGLGQSVGRIIVFLNTRSFCQNRLFGLVRPCCQFLRLKKYRNAPQHLILMFLVDFLLRCLNIRKN